jgi:hypothetical protein
VYVARASMCIGITDYYLCVGSLMAPSLVFVGCRPVIVASLRLSLRLHGTRILSAPRTNADYIGLMYMVPFCRCRFVGSGDRFGELFINASAKFDGHVQFW